MTKTGSGASSTGVVAIIQARMGSIRMPAKVLSEVLGRPLLEHLVARLSRAARVEKIVMAIPASAVNDPLEALAKRMGIYCVRGSELDVLDRFNTVALLYPAETYVRITGDCPLIDPTVVDHVIEQHGLQGSDYARTDFSFPDGLDVEVFSGTLLHRAAEEARENYDREHVTPFIRRAAGESVVEVSPPTDLSRLRLTIDEPEDFAVLEAIFSSFGDNTFSLDDIASLAAEKPGIFVPNQHLRRDEGASMSTGEKLWTRAKRVIPGGNHLLSKRAEMHMPKGWPTYFSRTLGCQVWDLDGRPYWDLGYMGIGTNILGYSHPVVDEAVQKVVASGNLSTLNCPEEVLLAEKLCELHPWADMARFTRSGGEAGAVAVRIARAASGKDGVAICGYHGWHDWYLSANLADDEALDQHLLSGLEPNGVPRRLAGLVRPFTYNDLEGLRKILESGDVGTIFMEVERSQPPAEGFLEGVRKLATQFDAVLVFDECTSGFRRVLGGLHLHYGVDPDIAVLGKTLGNGYAINAVIGRRAVMEAAQSTFISSTFWSERIGPTAALATLNVMADEDAPRRIHEVGLSVRSSWEHSAAEYQANVRVSGLAALNTFSIEGYDPAEVKTFFTTTMLKQGFLASSALYASLAHTSEILASFIECWHDTLGALVRHGSAGLQGALPSGIAQSGFQRLN